MTSRSTAPLVAVPGLENCFFKLKSEPGYSPFHDLLDYFERYVNTTYKETLEEMCSLFTKPASEPTATMPEVFQDPDPPGEGADAAVKAARKEFVKGIRAQQSKDFATKLSQLNANKRAFIVVL